MSAADRFGHALRWHRPLMLSAAAMALVAAGGALGYAVDTRMLDEVSVWAKPLTFSVSFAVYAGTLAWLISQLADVRESRFAHAAGTVIAAAASGEMLAIAVAVALLRRSNAGDRVTRWALGLGVTICLAGMAVGFLMVTPRAGQDPGAGVVGGHGVGQRWTMAAAATLVAGVAAAEWPVIRRRGSPRSPAASRR